MDGPNGTRDYSPEAAKFRAQIRSMLAANLPARWVGLGDKSLDEREEFCARWRPPAPDSRVDNFHAPK